MRQLLFRPATCKDFLLALIENPFVSGIAGVYYWTTSSNEVAYAKETATNEDSLAPIAIGVP